MEAPPLNEQELNEIYNWIDEIPLTRPKKNITRDFADGVLMAEVVSHYLPRLVELHNYSSAHSMNQKLYNWNTLNQKVLKKMGFNISKVDIDKMVNCVPDAVERVLKVVQTKIENYMSRKDKSLNSGTVSQQNLHNPQSQQVQISNQGDKQILLQKDETIQELRETVEILELKIKKLEQLVTLKDNKIQTLASKLQQITSGAR